MHLNRKERFDQKSRPAQPESVRKAMIGRQFHSPNEGAWANEFFTKHPVLSLQEQIAFAKAERQFMFLSANFVMYPETKQLFSETIQRLELAIQSQTASSDQPFSLLEFLDVYNEDLKSQLEAFKNSNKELFDRITNDVGYELSTSFSGDPAKLFLFCQRLASTYDRLPKQAVNLLLILIFVGLVNLSCVAAAPVVQVEAPVPALVDPESPSLIDATTPTATKVAATPTARATSTRPTVAPTRTATPTKTEVAPKTPTPTTIAAAEQAATPELTVSPELEKAILRVVATIINVRNYPSTESTSRVIAQLKKDQVVDIIGKAINGWWEVKLADGSTGFVTNESQYVVAENTANVPNVSNPDRPTPAPTPVRQETTVTKEWVTINTQLLSFSSPGRGQLDTIVEPGKYTIIQKDGPWLKITLPNGTSVWVLGTNQTVESETSTVTIQPTNPDVVQMPGSPEATSELFTTSIFDGMKTVDGSVVVATGGLDLTSAARRTSYGSNVLQMNCPLLTGAISDDGISIRASFAPGGARSYEAGAVVSSRSVVGGIEVTMKKVDGTTVVRFIPAYFGVAFYTQIATGEKICVSGGSGPISPNWFPPNVIVGIGPTELAFAYSR